MREELEQAKNDFYSGNGEIDSQEDSQEIRPSLMENAGNGEQVESGLVDSNGPNFTKDHSSQEVSEDFNEEEWLKKWSEENPDILIPKEKAPDSDLDLDPEFDLDSFHID